MASNKNLRLQRTKKGDEEIKKKSHSLTQSERLVLAIVDGLTPMDGLRRKLSGMTDRRFILVMADLTAKGLLEEVLPATDQQSAVTDRAIDQSLIQSFVRQDPSDPVSITGLYIAPDAVARASNLIMGKGREESDFEDSGDFTDESIKQFAKQSEQVDFYLPLEPVVSGKNPKTFFGSGLITANDTPERNASSPMQIRREKRSRQIQVGYWLLFAGLICAILALTLLGIL